MKLGATVTNCDINTVNLKQSVRDSDIVIVSAGSSELVKADWIKPGAIVVDFGYHVLGNENLDGTGRIVGDVDSRARQVASLMTPVPGGIGPMTVTMLIENTVNAFMSQKAII
jgi:methylenetetrahydrofolate dehydrogenase (NADP+)/methenyltetrahydrofolate cyclohydrolase/formyltetrahydrofolate synthetase